jgi:hypothetical protein
MLILCREKKRDRDDQDSKSSSALASSLLSDTLGGDSSSPPPPPPPEETRATAPKITIPPPPSVQHATADASAADVSTSVHQGRGSSPSRGDEGSKKPAPGSLVGLKVAAKPVVSSKPAASKPAEGFVFKPDEVIDCSNASHICVYQYVKSCASIL